MVNNENSFLELLQKHEEIFDRTLGKNTSSAYTIESLKNTKPYHAKPFPKPGIQQLIFKKEVDRLTKFIIPQIYGKVSALC